MSTDNNNNNNNNNGTQHAVLHVAAFQVVNPHVATCRAHIEENVKHACALIREHHLQRKQANQPPISLYVMCEMSSCTYDEASFIAPVHEVTEVIPSRQAVQDSPSFHLFSELAQELQCYICFGFQRRLDNDQRTVAQAVINNKGTIELVYNKQHLCSFGDCRESDFFAPGGCPGGDRDMFFDLNGIRIGMSICYDLRFPEHFRHLAKLGCDLVLHPGAFPLDEYSSSWPFFSQTRALENQFYVLSVNMLGNSMITPPWIIPNKYQVKQLQEAKNDFLEFIVDKQVIEQVRRDVPLRRDCGFEWPSAPSSSSSPSPTTTTCTRTEQK